ncbi:MAG: hypothetical protein A3E78_12085 [Alphaproteobacteria bacterium RIFCSPHIGHO2_12_FULL_63_12]|nr:MAG: hypothetical protein A3E78_12085 [Alphaproteobacteria bacterium RIFCSPHIGHO2_12_FULL_63_12]
MAKLLSLPPASIIADEAAFQMRADTDAAHVEKLAADMRERGFLDVHPLIVIDRAGSWHLVDGFHRRRAAMHAGIAKVPCEVFDGTEDEAVTFGIAMNRDHGRQLDYPKDFKVAAAKLRAMGLTYNAISHALWPVQQKDKQHTKFNTVRKWLVPAYRDEAHVRKQRVGRSFVAALERETGQTFPDGEAVIEHVEKATKSQREEARQEGLLKGLETIDRSFNRERILPSPAWSTAGSLPKSSPGTPVLFLSDIHAGEVVSREEMGGTNAYSWAIMERRFETIFATTVELLTKHLAKPDYDGIVLALGGDMVTGEIHEELTETNEKPILECTFDLSSLLAAHFKRIADVFRRVHLVGIPGNHGRMSQKPKAKGYVRTNADYHTYKQIQRLLQEDDRFTFNFPLSPDVRFDVAGRRFLLTHGDQFRGGDGMIGPLGPIMRGAYKKAMRASAQGQGADAPFDTLMCGHFHTTLMLPRLIVNGSLKGYDEYASRGNFTFEYPSQMLFTVHPKHGITWYIPIHAYPYVDAVEMVEAA